MSDARRWPLAHDEEHIHALHGERPRQLREADVVADHEAAVVPVEPEAAEMIAGREIFVLAHRREQVRLIILCDAVPRAVKDARRVIDLSAAHIRDAASHKIHAKLRSQPAEFTFHPRAVLLGQLGKTLFREKTGVPCFRQDDHVRSARHRVADEPLRFREVLLRLREEHVHLDAGGLHPANSFPA